MEHKEIDNHRKPRKTGEMKLKNKIKKAIITQ